MKIEDLNLIVKMKFGSHLYGTDTPESDMDYKGVFLPTIEEIFLNKVPKSYSFSTKSTFENGVKNTKDDTDIEIYSLHYFIKLACEGQTVALDMLHAPNNMIIEQSYIWDKIVENRDKFYTKNLKAFIGYARTQAAKYGLKGSRLHAAKEFLEILSEFKQRSDDGHRLKKIWHLLPTNEHCKFINDTPNGVLQYQINGKIIQSTMRTDYAYEIISKYYNEYGSRAKLAAENKGIDWKALSHAMRAAFQVKELLVNNTITFPLTSANYIRNIKQGKYHAMEVIQNLEDEITVIEELTKHSSLPDKVDQNFWDQFVINTIQNHYFM